MRIFRFLKALIKYIIFGNRVSFSLFYDRLSECVKCDNCDDEEWKCKKCGCYLDKKCKWDTEKCPDEKW